MELYEVQILVEKSQYEILTQIAQDERRSLPEIVQDIIHRDLRYHQRHKMLFAAHKLQADYNFLMGLSDFNALDGDNFH